MILSIGLSELIKNILGIIAEFFILKTLFRCKNKLKIIRVSLVSLAFITMSLLPLGLMGNTDAAKDIADIVTLLSFVSYPYFFFKSEKKTILFWSGLIINATADFVVLMISLPFDNISATWNNLIYCSVYLILTVSFLIIDKRKAYKIKGELIEKIPVIIYIVVLLAELAAFYMVMLTKNADYQKEISDVLIVLSAAVVIVCIVFVVFMITRLTEKQKHSEKALEIQLQHNEAMQSRNTDIRKFRHDYKNHMMSLELLLGEGRFDEAQEYVMKLNSLPQVNVKNFCTGNTLADAILSVKFSDAASKGVDISFDGSIPAQGIDNYDLSVILGNALDNAIRATEKISPCEINVFSKKTGNFFVLKITNPVKDKVPIVNNNVATTKTDTENHGFGIEQIKSVAKKYNGTINIECDGEIFIIEAGLIIKEEKIYETINK